MTCFAFFVDVIYNQHKSIKTSVGHTQVNSGSNCGCFNKGMKHKPFHGFTNHIWDNLIGEMLYVKKHNWDCAQMGRPICHGTKVPIYSKF
jgi:hypothetical protein